MIMVNSIRYESVEFGLGLIGIGLSIGSHVEAVA